MKSDMETFDISLEQLQRSEPLFPDKFHKDPWVFYHATSSVFEPAIDAHGLAWHPGVCSQSDCESIVLIYKSMNWYGPSVGGYPVIQAYSLEGDFQNTHTKPIYLRESSTRSPMYAGKDFVGGESARGVRLALKDLDAYLTSDQIRADHYEKQRRSCIRSVQDGGLPCRVIEVDPEWLRSRLASLKPLRDRCNDLLSQYAYGVIYAVRFCHEDLSSLEFSQESGLACFTSISPERLVAKARLHCGDAVLDRPRHANWKELQLRPEVLTGLLLALGKRSPQHRLSPGGGSGGPLPHQRKGFIDESAGINHGIEIARKHGNPAIIEYLRQNPVLDWNV